MIKEYLDISTGHLTQVTIGQLRDNLTSGWPAMTIAPYEYGVFVSVPTLDDLNEEAIANLPRDLRDVLVFADNAACETVRFDAEGTVFDGLPTYDW